MQSLDPCFERHDNWADHHTDENAQLGEARQNLRLVELKANRRQGRRRIENLQLYDGGWPATLIDGYIGAESTQNGNEVRSYRHAEIDGHRSVKSFDMHRVAEPLMKTECNEAAQEALGKLVVVPGFRDGPISQHRFRTEFDDRSLEIQTMPPVEEPE